MALKSSSSFIIVLFVFFIGCRTQSQVEKKITNVFLNENFNYAIISEDAKNITELWKNHLEKVIESDEYTIDSLIWDINHDSIAGLELYFLTKSLREPFQAEILNVQKLDSNTFSVKTAFSEPREINGVGNLISLNNIYDVIVKKENKSYKARSFLKHYTQNWNTASIGNIIYHFDKDHKFNHKKAQQMSDFCDTLKNLFDNSDIPKIEYYIFDNTVEMFWS